MISVISFNNGKMELLDLFTDGSMRIEDEADSKTRETLMNLPFIPVLKKLIDEKESKESRKEVFRSMRPNDVELCIKTASYICFDKKLTNFIIEEFLWKIGGESKEFYKFFNDDLQYVGKYKEVGMEIERYINEKYVKTIGNYTQKPEKACFSVRFQKYDEKAVIRKLEKRNLISTYTREDVWDLHDNPSLSELQSKELYVRACAVGNLRLLVSSGCVYIIPLFPVAIQYDQREILERLFSACPRSIPEKKHLATLCFKYDSVNCFEFLSKIINIDYGDALIYACCFGNKRIIEYVSKKEPEKINRIKEHTDLCCYTTRNLNLDCLVYLHENGWKWSTETVRTSILYENFDAMRYAVENGCHVSHSTVVNSVLYGSHFEVFEYLIEKTPVTTAYFENICFCQDEKLHERVFIYLIEKKYPFTSVSIAFYVVSGKLEYIKRLRELGCPWDNRACYNAIVHNKLDCLKYFCDNGLKPGKNLFYTSVIEKRYNITLYLLEIQCPFDKPRVLGLMSYQESAPNFNETERELFKTLKNLIEKS